MYLNGRSAWSSLLFWNNRLTFRTSFSPLFLTVAISSRRKCKSVSFLKLNAPALLNPSLQLVSFSYSFFNVVFHIKIEGVTYFNHLSSLNFLFSRNEKPLGFQSGYLLSKANNIRDWCQIFSSAFFICFLLLVFLELPPEYGMMYLEMLIEFAHEYYRACQTGVLAPLV